MNDKEYLQALTVALVRADPPEGSNRWTAMGMNTYAEKVAKQALKIMQAQGYNVEGV